MTIYYLLKNHYLKYYFTVVIHFTMIHSIWNATTYLLFKIYSTSIHVTMISYFIQKLQAHKGYQDDYTIFIFTTIGL